MTEHAERMSVMGMGSEELTIVLMNSLFGFDVESGELDKTPASEKVRNIKSIEELKAEAKTVAWKTEIKCLQNILAKKADLLQELLTELDDTQKEHIKELELYHRSHLAELSKMQSYLFSATNEHRSEMRRMHASRAELLHYTASLEEENYTSREVFAIIIEKIANLPKRPKVKEYKEAIALITSLLPSADIDETSSDIPNSIKTNASAKSAKQTPVQASA